MALAFLTLLHVLVFIYWLGGELGAFYAARIIAAPDQAVAARLAAARVLGTVDVATGTPLILTLPTGLSLASAEGWMVMPPWGSRSSG